MTTEFVSSARFALNFSCRYRLALRKAVVLSIQRRCFSKKKAIGPDWSKETLATSPKHPLSQKVHDTVEPTILHKKKSGGITYKKVHLRPQIVSEELCDDILASYGSALKNYKGCDIIDINPGAGLWSRKIHDFLQPRSHILLEPEPELWKKFLDPLVNMPDSRYRLAIGDTNRLDVFDELIEGGFFPHQKKIPAGDPRANELNETLLVTGSFAWEPMMPGYGFDSMGKQLLFKHIAHSRHNELFHVFGKIRMLMWLRGDDMKLAMPRNLSWVQKSNFITKKLADTNTIVTTGHIARGSGRDAASGREPRYEIESLVKALKAMRANGAELPSRRREHIHDFADDVSKMTNGTGQMSTFELYQYLREQRNQGKIVDGLIAENTLRIWAFDALAELHPELKYDPSRPRPRGPSKFSATKAQIEMTKHRAQEQAVLRERIKKDEAAEIGEKMYHLECKILSMREGKTKNAKLELLKQLQKDFQEKTDSVKVNYRNQVFNDVDDRINLRTGNSRTLWDARSFEPLVMQPEEAWPASRLGLADIVPKPTPANESREDFEYLQDFVLALFDLPSEDLITALERIQAGASALVDDTPSLRDPAKGGRLDLTQLRVRMLTTEMVEELCKAYHSWPFKNPEAAHTNYFRAKMGGL